MNAVLLLMRKLILQSKSSFWCSSGRNNSKQENKLSLCNWKTEKTTCITLWVWTNPASSNRAKVTIHMFTHVTCFYLPPPFACLFLWERGLYSAAHSYQTLSQRKPAAHTAQTRAKVYLAVFVGVTVNSADSSGMQPWRHVVTPSLGRVVVEDERGRGEGRETAINMNIHRAWAASCTA